MEENWVKNMKHCTVIDCTYVPHDHPEVAEPVVNKTHERLAEEIHTHRCECRPACRRGYYAIYDGELADAILQSPDLRVTLVEPPAPRYEVEHFLMGGKMHWRVNEILATKPFKSIVEVGYFGVDSSITEYIDRAEKAAKEYCAWLNSKEPK